MKNKLYLLLISCFILNLIILNLYCTNIINPNNKPDITIKYIIVENKYLPRINENNIDKWLNQVKEILKDEVNINFVKIDSVEINDFYTKYFLKLNVSDNISNYNENKFRNDIIYELNKYNINDLGKLFAHYKEKNAWSYEDYANNIKILFGKRYNDMKNILGFQNDVDNNFKSSSYFWDKIIKNTKEFDMVITNQFILKLSLFNQEIKTKAAYDFIPINGLSDFDNKKIIISLIPWIVYSKNERNQSINYDESKDYYVASVILHEIGHAIFSLPHNFDSYVCVMNPLLNNSKYLHEKIELCDYYRKRIRAWKSVQLSNNYEIKKEYNKSTDELIKAINIDNTYLSAYEQLINILNKNNNKIIAAKYEEILHKINNDNEKIETINNNIYIHYYLGWKLENEGENIDKAIDEYKEVVNINYSQISQNSFLVELYKISLKRLCNIYSNQIRYKESIECFTKTLDIFPDDKISYYFIGLCYLNMNNNIKAAENFKIYLQIDPNGENINLAKRYLKEIGN